MQSISSSLISGMRNRSGKSPYAIVPAGGGFAGFAAVGAEGALAAAKLRAAAPPGPRFGKEMSERLPDG